MRVSKGHFNFRTDCLFCGRMVIRDTYGLDDTASEVRTDSFPRSILACCEERCDDWFFTVKVSLHIMKQQIFSFIC